MGVSYPSDYFIDIENIYAFKGYCHHKSYEAFEGAIARSHYPTRYRLLFYCLFDTITSPYHVSKKICEVALYVWNLSNAKDHDGDSLHLDQMHIIIALSVFQLSIPFICTAIRISSSAAGLMNPKYALEGWKLAEAGEELAYSIWNQHLHNPPCYDTDRQVCEEIYPANAIFYLGLEQARQILVQEPETYQQIEEDIQAIFSDMLNHMLRSNPKCFRKLLYYEIAVKLPKLTSKEQKAYDLSHDTKHILLQLKEGLIKEDSPSSAEDATVQEDLDLLLIDQISEHLTVQEKQRLVKHIYLNLRGNLLCEELALDPQLMEQQFTQLSDLFSLRLKFGRAHFRQSSCHLQP